MELFGRVHAIHLALRHHILRTASDRERPLVLSRQRACGEWHGGPGDPRLWRTLTAAEPGRLVLPFVRQPADRILPADGAAHGAGEQARGLVHRMALVWFLGTILFVRGFSHTLVRDRAAADAIASAGSSPQRPLKRLGPALSHVG